MPAIADRSATEGIETQPGVLAGLQEESPPRERGFAANPRPAPLRNPDTGPKSAELFYRIKQHRDLEQLQQWFTTDPVVATLDEFLRTARLAANGQ